MTDTQLEFTPIPSIYEIHGNVSAGFIGGKLKDLKYRKYQLLQLLYVFKDHHKRWEDALYSDLGKPSFETNFFELHALAGQILEAHSNVDKWATHENAPFDMKFFAMRPQIRKEPKGPVLIMGPFNYPLFLTIVPLAGAIAAGCPVVIKPSEQIPATSALLAELFPKYMDPQLYHIVNGGKTQTTELIKLRWGHILFTGSGPVGKIIAAAAAQTLTPVTLELGGKAPVFIDPNTDLALAARRVLWGKLANAGQTCMAPDYVLVPREIQDRFIDELKRAHAKFFPDNAPLSQPGQFGRIISSQAVNRLAKMLDSTNGKVALGGKSNAPTRFMEITIVKDVPFDDSLMSEEIFGPILPLVPVDSLEEGIRHVNSCDHPLAVYVFSSDAQYKEKVFSNTQSGAAIANDVLMQAGVPGLPFGGIGPSGHSGQYKGKHGFDLFTHQRATLDSPSWMDMVTGFRYPPYSDANTRKLNTMMPRNAPARPKGPPEHTKSPPKWWLLMLVLFAAGLAVTGSGVWIDGMSWVMADSAKQNSFDEGYRNVTHSQSP